MTDGTGDPTLNGGPQQEMPIAWVGLLWIGAVVADVALWLSLPWRMAMLSTGVLMMALAVIHTWGDTRATR